MADTKETLMKNIANNVTADQVDMMRRVLSNRPLEYKEYYEK